MGIQITRSYSVLENEFRRPKADPGGLGDQAPSESKTRHEKRQRRSCLFSCLGRELNNWWLSCILGGY